jgi:SNF2 family DNA or RNA helicase
MNRLLPNQQSAIAHLSEWRVGALFMEAGTAKTRVAVELVNQVPDIDLIVYVAPLHTIASVVSEVGKWGGFHCQDIYYIGIESISQSDRIYLDIYNKVRTSCNCFIIVDESLKIKNATAKCTKRMLELSTMAKYKLILNGTPLSKNLLDLKPQMDFLSSKILNMSDAEFKNTFCNYTTITKRFGGYKEYTKEFITGYENIDYLYSLIRHYVFECDLTLQIKQLYSTINYTLDEECSKEYYLLKDKYLNDEALLWKNNNIFLEMTQKMQHTYCCTGGKFEALELLFKNIDQSSTIIYCKYISSRKACVKRFPKATVLSYQKSAFGLNLQHLNNTIYFDKIWDYALRVQASRRTFRTGQEHDCRYWDLTGNVGLEGLIDRNVEKKIGMIEYFKGKTKEQLCQNL